MIFLKMSDDIMFRPHTPSADTPMTPLVLPLELSQPISRIIKGPYSLTLHNNVHVGSSMGKI